MDNKDTVVNPYRGSVYDECDVEQKYCDSFNAVSADVKKKITKTKFAC